MSESLPIVGFDITPMLYGRGVSRYTSNIIRALRKKNTSIRFFGSSFRANRALKNLAREFGKEVGVTGKPSILSFPPSFLARMWYGVGRLHIESLMSKVDVFHAWEELVPPSYTTPIVATIHDLAPFKFPQMAHPSTREKHAAAYKRLKEYGSHVIAVSEQTKKDLIEMLEFDEKKIHVIYEALPTENIVKKEDMLPREDLEKLYGITKPYFLWVGTQEPRKNLKRAYEAWKQFSGEYDLVLIGASGTREIKPEAGVKILGYLTNAQVASFYKHAELLLFPSLYEGFGLPILEAFQYDCPVVTTNNSGMSESAGDAATFIDPYSVQSIAEGIGKTLKMKNKADRSKKMKAQLAKFSWEKAAKDTLEVYRLAIRDGFPKSKRPVLSKVEGKG